MFGAGRRNNMRVVMVDCTNTILREIAIPEIRPRDVAQSYRLAMESGEAVDWAKVNSAIIERWGIDKLITIKTTAHSGRCFANGGK